MKKNEITHFSINSYDVGKGLHDEFPKFQLQYEGKELLKEVQVLKGGFINSGKDITGLKGDSDISIILPDGCNVKDIKVESINDELSDKLNDRLRVKAYKDDDSSNIINIGIHEKLMAEEGIKYTAVIETKEVIKNLHNKLKFNHRIPNTSTIKNEYIGQLTQTQESHFISFLQRPIGIRGFGVLCFTAFILFGIFSMGFLFAQKVSYSINKKGTNQKLFLYMTPQSQLYVSENEVFPFFHKQLLSKEELDKNYEISLDSTFSWSADKNVIGFLFAFLSILYLCIAFHCFYLWNKKKKIYHMLKQYEKE